MAPHQVGEGYTLRGPTDSEGRVTPWACEYCAGARLPGIHFPSNFDDRPESRDGMVFIARCDTCGHVPGYTSDVGAAEAVSEATGWPIQKSYDEGSEVYYRPYFEVTLKQAEDFMEGR